MPGKKTTPSTPERRKQSHALHGGLEVHELPPGLLSAERQWIEARAAQVGGLTAAFCHLVRLGILHDAAVAFWKAHARVVSQARREGLSRAEIERRVRTWAESRAAEQLGARLRNSMVWRRPGEPGGYGEDAEDDPAVPLPRARVRHLIAEGRAICDEE